MSSEHSKADPGATASRDPIGNASAVDAAARVEQERRYAFERQARAQLVRDLNHAVKFDSPTEFASRLFSVLCGLRGCGIHSPQLPTGTPQRDMGAALLRTCQEERPDRIEAVAERARQAAMAAMEAANTFARPVYPPDSVAKWQAEHEAQIAEMVAQFFAKGRWEARWRMGNCGLSHLRWGIWRDLGALANVEEEDGVFIDLALLLDVDDPKLPLTVLCELTSADVRTYVDRRLSEPLLRLPIRTRRNIDRIRAGCRGDGAFSQIPVDVAAPSNETCVLLLRWLEGVSPASDSHATDSRSLIVRALRAYTFRFRGVYSPLPRGAGEERLVHLLVNPGTGFSAIQLLAQRTGTVGLRAAAAQDVDDHAGPSVDPLLDDKAVATYRQRLSDLTEEIAEARTNNDESRLEPLLEEQEFIRDQILEALGRGGRPRRLDPAEKNVQGRVSTSINRTLGQLAADLRTFITDRLTLASGGNRYDPRSDDGPESIFILEEAR